MTTLDTTRLAPARPVFSRFTQSVTAFWAVVQERRGQRRQRADLARYDARLLADMGVEPSEIRAITRRRGDNLDSWRYHGDLD